VEDQLAFLGEVGEALVDVAASLRAASLEDPLGYRLLRAALWLPLVRAPTADTDGKTGLDPLPEDLRGELERAEANQAWHELLRACEQALPRHPLALWLQRLAATALAGLQLVDARQAVQVEVRALLGRFPQLAALRYSDGSPLADEATRDWLVSNELLRPDSARPRPAPASAAEAPLEPPLALAQRALSLGARKEAMAQAALALKGATSDRERFLARLAQAQACALGGDPALAPALFQKLDAEVLAKGLELWEPLLAAQVLKGILGLGRPSVDTPQTWWGDYLSRLFLIDPQGALELKAPKDRGSA
jgi:type VI secretion system protein VasJ